MRLGGGGDLLTLKKVPAGNKISFKFSNVSEDNQATFDPCL